ncbi:MAG: hydroxymethylglutaryl-CoA lyase, partial [Candidatus Marinimicrobia bacterium]|nr:hydroxymethylglutaryl-CoA lyase [Candidatus Neomarinimicrobiota bacterium]
VEIMEVGLRDGLQNIKENLSVEDRVSIIHGLIESGIKNIQIASFVSPRRVPQMAQAETLVKRISNINGIEFSGLIFNQQGIERAMGCGLRKIETSISMSEIYSQKNLGMDVSSSLKQLEDIVKMAKKNSLNLRAGLQCVWGYEENGNSDQSNVLERLKQIIAMGVKRISLCDTRGMANPKNVASLLEWINNKFPDIDISIHFHNTNGLGLVNLFTALNHGIKEIDTSLGGIGGSPFIKNSKGNIATEDTVYLLDSLGYEMGIDIKTISKLSKFLEKKIGSSYFGGKIYKII